MACNSDCSINPYLNVDSNPPRTCEFASKCLNQRSCEHDMSQYVPLAVHIGLENELNMLKFQMGHPDESLVNNRPNVIQKDSTAKQPQKESHQDFETQIVFLQMDKINLELEIKNLKNTIEIVKINTYTQLERDLELSRDRERQLQSDVDDRDQQIRKLRYKIQTTPDDTAFKEDRIVLLQEKESLHALLGQLQQRLSGNRRLEYQYSELTRKFNEAEWSNGQLQRNICFLENQLKTQQISSDTHTRLLNENNLIANKLHRSQQLVKELENNLAAVPTANDTLVTDLINQQDELRKKYEQKCEDAKKLEFELTDAHRNLAQIKNRMTYPNYSYPGLQHDAYPSFHHPSSTHPRFHHSSSTHQTPDRGVYHPP